MQDQAGPSHAHAEPSAQPPQSSIDDYGNEAAKPTNSAEAADNGWGEHVGWDFQDVPLDSPRGPAKHASTSQHAEAAQVDGAVAGHSLPNARQSTDAGQQDGDALQQENEVLRKRLKQVQAVRPPPGRIDVDMASVR